MLRLVDSLRWWLKLASELARSCQSELLGGEHIIKLTDSNDWEKVLILVGRLYLKRARPISTS